MSNSLTLGVIGHVDHGKTALVRALTGIETDRLREERERGLSIVLGFAFLESERGVVDLIDVPGHEDFIRAMIGGATALDGIVLCVAANEGVMPQTVEHFNIARLLGVRKGFSVLTKSDLVDRETLALAHEDLREFLHDTFLEGAPVLEASAISGAGIDAVREALVGMTAAPVERASHAFFLPLDRVFTMHGFGLVVTGTLRGGEISVGDDVEIMPARRPATVRGLQNHNQPVARVAPGQRVAANLRNVERASVNRGDVLASPGSVVPTSRLDADLHLLEDAAHPVKNGAVVRLLTGTTEVMAKLRLLDRSELAPGETSMVQLSLDRNIATRSTEHFLIRSQSPMRTIGGGHILDVDAKRHRRFDAAVTRRLETVASGDPDLMVRQRLEEAGARGVRLDASAKALGVDRARLAQAAQRAGALDLGEGLVVDSRAYEALSSRVVALIEQFHDEHPLKNGLAVGSLIDQLRPTASADVLKHALGQLVERGAIDNVHEVLRIAGHDPFSRLGDQERKLVDEVERAFIAPGLEAPPPETIVGSDDGRKAAYRLLLETGRLVCLKTHDRSRGMVMHALVLDDAKRAIEHGYPYPKTFALKDVRDVLRSTRKYVVPLMEHLDATGATVRLGDLRRVKAPWRRRE